MTEFNDKRDRIRANNWFTAEQCLQELDKLRFGISSFVVLHQQGSNEYEISENAVRGVKARIDYLHDSLRRLLEQAK